MGQIFGDMKSGILKENYGEQPMVAALRKRREKLAASKIGVIDTDDLNKDLEESDASGFADKKPKRGL